MKPVARLRAPWLLLLAIVFGQLYGQLHQGIEAHVECAAHPGEWTHDEPAHHESGDGEHDHCSIVKLHAPACEPVDAEPALVAIATLPFLPEAPLPAPILASTPLLLLAPKTSPPTAC